MAAQASGRSGVAVVLSSAALLSVRCGGIIDQYRTVYRFNRAVTAGYEAHVGTRTTHEVVHTSGGIESPAARFARNNTLHAYGVTFDDFGRTYGEWKALRRKNWLLAPRQFVEECAVHIRTRCSSGLLLLWMLTSLGVRPTVFGLPYTSSNTTDCIQYKYTDTGCTMRNHTEHAFAREHTQIKRWVRDGTIANGSLVCQFGRHGSQYQR